MFSHTEFEAKLVAEDVDFTLTFDTPTIFIEDEPQFALNWSRAGDL